MSQSGALGLAVIDRAARLGLGLSTFVSVGNKADVSGNDLLEYWEADPETDVILLYLESFGNPRRFSRIAQRVGRAKPILAVKSGRSPAGARATSSHTGALLARPDGFLVQPMAAGGVEMIVGVVQDPLFGPVVACGAGGTAVELLKDVGVRLAPLTESDADRMIHGLASLPLLQGYRGSAPADIPALRDVLLRVGALAEDLPEVVELDLNPVLAGPDGSRVLDARLRLEAREPLPPEGARPRSRRR
jgi:acyl-CoA synthetase (NDP forming)